MNRFLYLFGCLMLSFLVACERVQDPLDLQAGAHENGPADSRSAASNDLFALSVSEHASTDPLLKEVHRFIQRRKADLLSEPGWLHLITRQTVGETTALPGDETISSVTEQEGWFFLDEQGQISLAVTRLLDGQGQSDQVRIFQDGAWKFPPASSDFQTNPMDHLWLDFGFYQQAEVLMRQGNQLNRQTLYNNCWYSGEKYSILEGQLLHEALFNPDDGKLRSLKTWKISSNAISLVRHVDVLVDERVAQPPADVLAVLDDQPE